MNFKDIENRDDYYVLDSNREFRVKDCKGVFVVYGILTKIVATVHGRLK